MTFVLCIMLILRMHLLLVHLVIVGEALVCIRWMVMQPGRMLWFFCDVLLLWMMMMPFFYGEGSNWMVSVCLCTYAIVMLETLMVWLFLCGRLRVCFLNVRN